MSKLPGDKSGGSAEDGAVVLPWRAACLAFEYHILNKALQKGMALSDVMDLLDRCIKGEVVEEVRVILDELITETEGKAIARLTRGESYSRNFAVKIPEGGWNRSEPTKAGGLMVGPGSPLYGRRIMRDPKELLASFPPEMIDQMGDELATSYAGGVPEIKGVMTPNGLYQPTSVDKLTDKEIHNLGLKYVIYPAGQVPENERENLQHWLDNHAIGKGKVSWNASNIPKDDMKKLCNGEMPIRGVPGIELKITVPTGAGMFSSQSREADKR